MPARDHIGKPLPPAERSDRLTVTAEAGAVTLTALDARGDVPVTLTEQETRGLLCELSAAWARAFSEQIR